MTLREATHIDGGVEAKEGARKEGARLGRAYKEEAQKWAWPGAGRGELPRVGRREPIEEDRRGGGCGKRTPTYTLAAITSLALHLCWPPSILPLLD